MGHDELLDLVGAFVDLGGLRVAHQPFHLAGPHVPHAAEELYGVGGDLHRGVGGEALGGRGVEAQVVRSALGPYGRRVGELPCGGQLHGHRGDHEFQSLELGEEPAEPASRPEVGDRVVQGRLGDADRLGRDEDPAVVEGLQGHREPGTGLADEPVLRDTHVPQVDLAPTARPGRRTAGSGAAR